MKTRNIFTIALKAISFCVANEPETFLLIILLNIFMGAVVYVQYASFASIVDEIIRIKQGTSDISALITASTILGLSFLIPTVVSNVLSYSRTKFRMQQGVQLEMHKIEKQGGLDIGTIESTS